MRQNIHGFICLQPPPLISTTSPATLLSFHTISSDTLRLFLKLRLLTWCRRPSTTCLCGRTLPRTILCGAGESHSTPLNCALQQRRSRTGHVSLHFFPLPFLFSFVLSCWLVLSPVLPVLPVSPVSPVSPISPVSPQKSYELR